MLTLQRWVNPFTLIRLIGHTPGLTENERLKLGIFNVLNFFGLLTGICIPLAGSFNEGYLPWLAWIVAVSPAIISFSVLLCNYFHRYETAMRIYFILYPLATALVYAGSIDAGIELFFVFYGVLSIFFLKNFVHTILAFSLSAACYFTVYVFAGEYRYKLEDINFGFYVFNQLLALGFIFITLILIRRENNNYQQRILSKSKALQRKNIEIEDQKAEIAQKAEHLEITAAQLTELNGLKNKLFSIIAHDLKTPLYSLRNLFRNMFQYDLPGEEIKVLLPDIVNDLNYTTGLMENLLQWAKSQMQGSALNQELLDVTDMIGKTMKLLRLQADAKKVYITNKADGPVYIYADKDMIDLVLRNLVSNAIKYTPAAGEVTIGAIQKETGVEVFVKDTGMGIPPENMGRLFGDNFFTTKGTANECGTGLGLVLCKTFLDKNGGNISVVSEPGKGSIFSFTLPVP
jgi:signal transduction histidine kinase